MTERRPVRNGMKRLGKMTRRELQDEIKRLDEVLEITARRHANLKVIVDKIRAEEFEESVRRFCPGPALKKTATNAQICLESANDDAN
jgi:hypothetical protein